MELDLGRVLGKVFTSPSSGRTYGVIRELQGKPPVDFPTGWTPAAEDECGNYFAVSAAGAVGFWDHETGEIELIADSVLRLYENSAAPGDVELKPGQVKSAWIDPEFARKLGLKDAPKDGWIKRRDS